MVSDGNTTVEALEYLRPVTDVFRVDLKGTEPAHYQVVGGVPGAPLAALRAARRLGYWVEAVTVVVPGVNDDLAGLRQLAEQLAAIDPDLPWHLNAFVPRYRLHDRPATDPASLVSAAGTARMTQTGLSLGTPQYMSPEQAMGERSVDKRTDIYALGAVLYEMLTGEPPFTGATVQAIVAKVMAERPVPPSTVRDTVPIHVEDAVLTALAKLPADRFGSASEFSHALGQPSEASTLASASRRATKMCRARTGGSRPRSRSRSARTTDSSAPAPARS